MKVRRALWPVLGSVVLIGVLFTAVFPTRTFLAQRASISRAEKQLEVLEEQNEVLERRTAELRTDAEIERLAREQYSLVRPGEEAYALLPAPATPDVPAAESTLPDADEAEDDDDRNLAERAWGAVTGWF